MYWLTTSLRKAGSLRAWEKHVVNTFARWGENLSSHNTKPFWSFMKSLRQSSTGVASLKTASGIAVSPLEKANALNSQFKSVFTQEDCQDLPASEYPAPPSMPPIRITTQGITKLLQELKPHKAPGPDGILPSVLKECAVNIAPLLQPIFQKSIDTGELPNDWLNANVSPIFKKGNRAEPSNYRPVSLTSIPCKLLEHIIHTNVMGHFEKYNIINEEQHGFRKGRSCESQLALTINDLAKILDRQGQADVVITDFSKAFDTVPHKRLLLKLHRSGITGALHSWFKNFLTTRSQSVVLDSVSSSSVWVQSGVPQGTVLGPLLFILYISDLPQGIKSQVRLFADDCILYREIKTEDDKAVLQNDIDTLCSWESKWQMKFNIDKCHVMHITHKRKPLHTYYTMNGDRLNSVTNHTYLGVELNSKLNWADHVNNTATKANKVLGLLRRNLYSCPQKVKETAYKALVRPKLEYCASVWDPYKQDHKNRLEAVQRRAARFVCKDSRRTSSVSTMITKLGWKPLENRRAISRLSLLFKSIHHTVAINTDKYLTSQDDNKICTRKSCEISFTHPTVKKDCYKHSFLPRTMTEWNLLPPNIRQSTSVDSLKSKLNNMDLTSFIRGAHY